MDLVNDVDPVFLSLDDIIRLNKEKNKRSGSVKSFGSHRSNRSNYSNRSNKSNYSNRSYGGMSHKSNMSTYSNRSRSSFKGRRGQDQGYQNCYSEQNNSYASLGNGSFKARNKRRENGKVHHEFYKPENYRGSDRSGYNYWSIGRYPYNHLHNLNTYSYARNRVKNALKYLHKSQKNYKTRNTPYQNIKRQLLTTKRWVTQKCPDVLEDREDMSELSVVVKNDKAFPSIRRKTGLTVRRLTKFNNNYVSPLRKTSLVLSRKTASANQNPWGPKLDPEIQEEIERFMQNSRFISEDLSVALNQNLIVPSTTSLLLHERFGSYL